MFEQYAQQLKSPDAARRREAVIALGKSGDPAALPYLAQVYRADPDPALRELAAKAGRHIQKLRQQSTAQPPPEPPPASNLPDILAGYARPLAGSYDAAYDQTPPAEEALSGPPEEPRSATSNLPDILAGYTKPAASSLVADTPRTPPPEIDISQAKPISPERQKQAKGRLNNAFAFKTRGDDENALLELARALQLNPGLAKDSAAVNLATSLVGGSGQDAIALVLERSQSGPRRRLGFSFDTEVIDMLISALILLITITLFNLAFFYGTLILSAVITAMMFGGRPEASQFQELLTTLSLQSVLPEILRGAAITLGATFFQTIVIYFVGTMMGGTGSFITFAKVMMNVQTAFYVTVAVAFGLMIFGVFSGSDATMTTLVQIGAILLGVTIFGGLGIQAYFAGRVHDYGFFKGLVSVVVGSTAAGIIASLLGMFDTPETAFQF